MSDSFFMRGGVILALACAAAGCVDGGPVGPTDEAAPRFVISHEQNATNQKTATISGTVTDSVGVARVTYRLNGGTEQAVTITPGTSVSFSAAVAMPAEINTLEFAAYDAAGNRGSETLEVRYDVTPPVVSASYLVEGGSFHSFLRLSGSATDATSGVRQVTYSANGGAEQQITGGYKMAGSDQFLFSGDAYGLPLGKNTFVVYAYDRAGNRAQIQATMTRVQ